MSTPWPYPFPPNRRLLETDSPQPRAMCACGGQCQTQTHAHTHTHTGSEHFGDSSFSRARWMMLVSNENVTLPMELVQTGIVNPCTPTTATPEATAVTQATSVRGAVSWPFRNVSTLRGNPRRGGEHLLQYSRTCNRHGTQVRQATTQAWAAQRKLPRNTVHTHKDSTELKKEKKT